MLPVKPEDDFNDSLKEGHCEAILFDINNDDTYEPADQCDNNQEVNKFGQLILGKI